MAPIANTRMSPVPFAPRAYMGCGGWDLAKAPTVTGRTRRNPFEELPSRAARRMMGCGGGGFSAEPTPIVDTNRAEVETEVEEVEEREELSGTGCSCSSGVTMGCGDTKCEACAEMGCLKCKRARRKAMMQQNQELGAAWVGQTDSGTTRGLVGLGVAGAMLYLATQL